MTLPALVLVHGGGLAADSWDLTVAEIHRLAPELTVLAVDLPGRRDKPGDLRAMTIADFVDSLVGDIENAGWGTSSLSLAEGFPEPPLCQSQEPTRVRHLARSAKSCGLTVAARIP